MGEWLVNYPLIALCWWVDSWSLIDVRMGGSGPFEGVLPTEGPIRRDPCFFTELAPIYSLMILPGIASSLGTVLHLNYD